MFYRSYAKIEKKFNESNISSVVDFIYNIDPSNTRQMKRLNKWFIENWFQVDVGVGVAHEDKEKLDPIFRAMAEVFPVDEPITTVYRGVATKRLERFLSVFLFNTPIKDCKNIGKHRGLLFNYYLRKFYGNEEATEKFLNSKREIQVPLSIFKMHPKVLLTLANLAYGTRSWAVNKEIAENWGWDKALSHDVDAVIFIYNNPSDQNILFPVDSYMLDWEALEEEEIPGFDWGEVLMSVPNPKITKITLFPGEDNCRYEVEID